MNKKPKIKVYINASKPYHYPGEKYSATILIDAQEQVNCNKMTIIAKGMQLINASQTNKFAGEEKQVLYESSSSSDSDDEDIEKIKRSSQEDGPIVQIKEKKYIFKIKQDINISQSKVLKVGKHSFPFDLDIPDDIPGSFLYLEPKIYVEIIYSVKVKIEALNIKTIVPIIIRQRQELFNYQKSNEFERKIHGCCCIAGQTGITLTASEDYTLTGEPVKMSVLINNDTNTTTTPITVEVYRKLLLKGSNNKKIRCTKIVGAYQGKRIINAREKYQKKIHIAVEGRDYLTNHVNETKAAKVFKHKEIIPYLFQSIKSDNINCEFEVYAESQYANITNDDLGVFLSVLIYPTEQGILSKTVMNLSQSFVDGNSYKKFFLKGENLLKKESEEEEKRAAEKKKKKPKKKRKFYEESEMSQETIKFENKLADKKKKKKDDNSNIENEEEEEEEENINNFKSDELNSIMNNKNNINKINNNNINNNGEKETINDMDSNINDNKINKIKDSKNLNSADVSFGTSSKEKNYFQNELSSNIKKNFNKEFLKDGLDEELSDDEK